MVLVGANSLIPLQEGDYAIILRIGSEGNIRICKPILLHVGKTEVETVWDKSIADKILV